MQQSRLLSGAHDGVCAVPALDMSIAGRALHNGVYSSNSYCGRHEAFFFFFFHPPADGEK